MKNTIILPKIHAVAKKLNKLRNGKNGQERNRGCVKKKSKTEWARVKAMKDSEIDYSDIPSAGKEFFPEGGSLARHEEADNASSRPGRYRVLQEERAWLPVHDKCRPEKIF
jgi:hypothetical protein